MKDKFKCNVCKRLFIYAENSKPSHFDWINHILIHIDTHLKKGEIGMDTIHIFKHQKDKLFELHQQIFKGQPFSAPDVVGHLIRHFEEQEIPDPRDYKCEFCEKTFTDDINIESIEDIGYCIKCYNSLRQDIQPLPPRE